MRLTDVLRSAGRRWYILVTGLLITAGLAFAVFRFVPVMYEAQASVLLLPPPLTIADGGKGGPTDKNPFLRLGGLDTVSGVLSRSVGDSQTVQSVIPKGSKAEYTIGEDGSVSGSVLLITASDVSEHGSFAVLDTVIGLTESRLGELQDAVGAPKEAQVTAMVITDNVEAELSTSNLTRALIIVVVAGLGATVFVAIGIDALVRRRRARKAAKAASSQAETMVRKGRSASSDHSAERTSPERDTDSAIDDTLLTATADSPGVDTGNPEAVADADERIGTETSARSSRG